MAAGWLSGTNLYQAKEPAFSREQKELLYPKVIFLPDDDEIDGEMTKALTADAVYLGRFEFNYPRMNCRSFLRFRVIEKEQEEPDSEAKLTYSYTEPTHKKKRAAFFFNQKQEQLTVSQYEPEDLIAIAEKADIIDETDGKYLSQKLEVLFGSAYDALVCDAIDEQPYVSSNINTMLQKSEEVFSALKILAQAAGINNLFALCYADIDDAETVIPHKLFEIPIKRIFGRYPVRNRVKRHLAKYGRSYIIGTQALLHLYRAVMTGRVQNTTIITVAGDCVGNPRNIEVRVGTPAREVLEFCGLVKNPSRVVMGGSMRGVSIVDLDLPVLHTTRAVLAFEKPIDNPVLSCISCGRCIESCPRKLAPTYLFKQYNVGNTDALKQLRVDKCIECGVCSYICPANLELTHYIKKAKILVKGVSE